MAGGAPRARACARAARARGLRIRERLDTARLIGRRPTPDHLDELALVVQDPRVAESLWPGPLGGPRTAAQTHERLCDQIAHWSEHGFGIWMFADRASGDPVGYAGPRWTEIEGRPEVEIAYAVRSDRWGEGLGTEMARASVQAALEDGIRGLVCFTHPGNAASRRVMEKASFRYEREFERAGLPHVLYRWQEVGGRE
jgi:ribosomal-protein-alanine N-acetyltransferase